MLRPHLIHVFRVFRGANRTWGANRAGPLIVNWTGLGTEDKALLKLQLESTSDWILLALSAGAKASQIPPVRGTNQLLITTGKAYRQKGWWTSGNDHVVAYEKDLVVWISGWVGKVQSRLKW